MTVHPDAIDWWYDYAHMPGWTEIPSAAAPPDQRGVPEPGNVVIWDDGGAGHIAIVIDVQLPTSVRRASIAFWPSFTVLHAKRGITWPSGKLEDGVSFATTTTAPGIISAQMQY